MRKERKKRIILIGRTAAGKTTLCQRISNQDLAYHKTQTVQIIDRHMIDTPGEYLERRYFRGALLVTAADSDVVVLVQDASENGTMFPPAYSSSFAKPCIGVITKSDLASAEQLETAGKVLHLAGAQKIFVTSSVNGEGVDELLKFLGYL